MLIANHDCGHDLFSAPAIAVLNVDNSAKLVGYGLLRMVTMSVQNILVKSRNIAGVSLAISNV